MDIQRIFLAPCPIPRLAGLREKLLAARRSGMRQVLIPRENEKDLSEVPQEVLKDLDVVFVEHVDEVLPLALDAPAEKIFAGQGKPDALALSLRTGC